MQRHLARRPPNPRQAIVPNRVRTATRHGRGYWLWAVVLLGVISTVGWLGRHGAANWTHHQLAAQHARLLAELPDERAAEIVLRLDRDDEAWLDLLASLLADSRESVAAAAEQAIQSRLARWGAMRSTDSSPRVSALAAALARHAPELPPHRRQFAQRIAQRLLVWPLDRQAADPARLIADCERVLRLDLPQPEELRLAAVEPRPDASPTTPPPETAEPPAPIASDPPPAVEVPQTITPLEPDVLPDAGDGAPIAPRRFLPPRGIRISDE